MRRVVMLSAAALSLAACGNSIKEEVGLRRTAPDEFAVVTRAPLSVPPDYTLRPPRPGEGRGQETPVREVARQTVFGSSDMNPDAEKASSGFMGKFGAADPSIRNTVDDENGEGVEEKGKPVAKRLLFWKKDGSDKGVTLDPKKEMDRLQKDDSLSGSQKSYPDEPRS